MSGDRSIVITGFMGSGKTNLALALAKLLLCSATDLDSEIARLHRRTAAQLITETGEAAFREVESAVLRNVLERGARVIALGGGAWTFPANRILLSDFNAFSISLDVPFEDCWKRIEASGSNRPLAPDRKTAHALYDLRRPLYELADLRVEVPQYRTVQEVAHQIVTALPGDVLAAFK